MRYSYPESQDGVMGIVIQSKLFCASLTPPWVGNGLQFVEYEVDLSSHSKNDYFSIGKNVRWKCIFEEYVWDRGNFSFE